MSEFGPRQLVLIGIAMAVGLVLGGLGPRSEVRALRQEIAEQGDEACDRQVGREIASVFQGRPWEPPSGADPSVTAPAPEAPEPERTSGVQITVNDQPVEDGEEAEPDPETLDAMRDAMELRRTQAEAALREQAGATDAQMQTVDQIADVMNDDLRSLASEFVETVKTTGGEPTRHELMVFAAETLDVLLAAEEQMYDAFDAEQRASVDEEATDPLSFVDGRVVEILAELDL
jgi:hypothetical protein